MAWTALTATCVLYDRSSFLSLIAALLSLIPQAIAIVLATWTLAARTLIPLGLLLQQVVSTLLNVVVKRIIRQPRPIESMKDGFGMPSDHAQFMFSLTISLIIIMKKNATVNSRIKVVASLIMIILACFVAAARVKLHVHSIEQVVVGAVIGMAFGTMWQALLASPVLYLMENILKIIMHAVQPFVDPVRDGDKEKIY